jgi:hypothetical protein
LALAQAVLDARRMRTASWVVTLALALGCGTGEVDDDFAAAEEEEIVAGCRWPAEVVVWGLRYLDPLLDAIAAHPSPCVTWWVSLPPVLDEGGRKTVPRRGRVLDRIHELRASGVAIHAAAEFHWHSWVRYLAEEGGTWYDAGVEFRRRMDEQGYDAAAGDAWVIDEFPSSVRRDVNGARVHARNLVRGLFDGGTTRRRGAIFNFGVGSAMENYSVYKPQWRDLLCDAPFWEDMDAYVRWWAQEVYASPQDVCVGSAVIGSRSRHLNEFAHHPARLVEAAPACAARAEAYFDKAWTPLHGAAWMQERGYGDTTIPLEAMRKFLALEVYATRAWSGRHDYLDGRIGFGWATATGQSPNDVRVLADQVAASVQRAYGERSSAARACSPTGTLGGCDCRVSGSDFNPGWESWSTW